MVEPFRPKNRQERRDRVIGRRLEQVHKAYSNLMDVPHGREILIDCRTIHSAMQGKVVDWNRLMPVMRRLDQYITAAEKYLKAAERAAQSFRKIGQPLPEPIVKGMIKDAETHTKIKSILEKTRRRMQAELQ